MNKKTLIYEDKFHINFFVKKKKNTLGHFRASNQEKTPNLEVMQKYKEKK